MKKMHAYKVTINVRNHDLFLKKIQNKSFFIKMHTKESKNSLNKVYTLILKNANNEYITHKDVLSKQKIIMFNNWFMPNQCAAYVILLILLILLTLCLVKLFFSLQYHDIHKMRMISSSNFAYIYKQFIIKEFITMYNFIFFTFYLGFLFLFYDFYYDVNIYNTLHIPTIVMILYYCICRFIFYITFHRLIKSI